jgi:hypothetical protein
MWEVTTALLRNARRLWRDAGVLRNTEISARQDLVLRDDTWHPHFPSSLCTRVAVQVVPRDTA